MNLLQTFLASANVQSRAIMQEAFTLVDDAPPVTYLGTFGDPQLMPVMTRQGYQDHLVTPLKVEAVLMAALTPAQLNALARRSLLRTSTGRTMFIQMVDYTAVVVYTFILTDREV